LRDEPSPGVERRRSTTTRATATTRTTTTTYWQSDVAARVRGGAAWGEDGLAGGGVGRAAGVANRGQTSIGLESGGAGVSAKSWTGIDRPGERPGEGCPPNCGQASIGAGERPGEGGHRIWDRHRSARRAARRGCPPNCGQASPRRGRPPNFGQASIGPESGRAGVSAKSWTGIDRPGERPGGGVRRIVDRHRSASARRHGKTVGGTKRYAADRPGGRCRRLGCDRIRSDSG